MKSVLFVALALSLLVVACSGSRSPAERGELPENTPPEDSAACAPAPADEPEPEPAPKKRIVVTTGVHGNEPSGYLVQDQLAELGFTVHGPCNPWGIENNNRHLQDGRDLNRMFGRTDCPEAEVVKEWLKENPPDLLLDLHEDPDGTGAYLIQHGPDDEIGRKIVDALKGEYDFDPAPKFLMVQGDDGLLKPTLQILRVMALGKIYGLGYYAWATYGCTAIVVECPGSWPEEKRKAYQLAVCKKARELFEE